MFASSARVVLVALALAPALLAESLPPVVEHGFAPASAAWRAGDCTAPPEIALALESSLTPLIDVVISVDLTNGQEDIHTALHASLPALAARLNEHWAGADVAFALVSHHDYPGRFSSCKYDQHYGATASQPFKVEAPIGTDLQAIVDRIGALVIGDGRDHPESYGRVIWEVGQADSQLGLRPGSRRLLILCCDNLPHDCDLAEGIAIDPANPQACRVNVGSTGADPGRDGAIETDDDIDFQDDALPALAIARFELLTIYSGASPFVCYWSNWTNRVGGEFLRVKNNGKMPGDGSLLDELFARAVKLIDLTGEVKLTAATDADAIAITFDWTRADTDATTAPKWPVAVRESFAVDAALAPAGTRAQITVSAQIGGETVAEQIVQLTVGDCVPPAIKAQLVAIESSKPEELAWRVEVSATDDCDPSPTLVITVDDQPVTNGATVTAAVDAPPPRLTARARDATGNESTTE